MRTTPALTLAFLILMCPAARGDSSTEVTAALARDLGMLEARFGNLPGGSPNEQAVLELAASMHQEVTALQESILRLQALLAAGAAVERRALLLAERARAVCAQLRGRYTCIERKRAPLLTGDEALELIGQQIDSYLPNVTADVILETLGERGAIKLIHPDDRQKLGVAVAAAIKKQVREQMRREVDRVGGLDLVSATKVVERLLQEEILARLESAHLGIDGNKAFTVTLEGEVIARASLPEALDPNAPTAPAVQATYWQRIAEQLIADFQGLPTAPEDPPRPGQAEHVRAWTARAGRVLDALQRAEGDLDKGIHSGLAGRVRSTAGRLDGALGRLRGSGWKSQLADPAVKRDVDSLVAAIKAFRTHLETQSGGGRPAQPHVPLTKDALLGTWKGSGGPLDGATVVIRRKPGRSPYNFELLLDGELQFVDNPSDGSGLFPLIGVSGTLKAGNWLNVVLKSRDVLELSLRADSREGSYPAGQTTFSRE